MSSSRSAEVGRHAVHARAGRAASDEQRATAVTSSMLDVELRRERVVQERDRAPGERAEQVGGRARREVLAAERGGQVGVPVERPGRQAGSPVDQRRRDRRRRSGGGWVGSESGSRSRRSSWSLIVGSSAFAARTRASGHGDARCGPDRRGTAPAPNRAGARRPPLAADTQRGVRRAGAAGTRRRQRPGPPGR